MNKTTVLAAVGGMLALVAVTTGPLVVSDLNGLHLGVLPVVARGVASVLALCGLFVASRQHLAPLAHRGVLLAGLGLGLWVLLALLWADVREVAADSRQDAALAHLTGHAGAVALGALALFASGLANLAAAPVYHKSQRFLRILLTWNGQVVLERLFLQPQAVTVGESARCTFQLAASGLDLHALLQPVPGHTDRYHLRLPRGVATQLQLAGGPAPDESPGETLEVTRGDSGVLQFDNGLSLAFGFAAAESGPLPTGAKQERGLVASFGAVATVVGLLCLGMVLSKPTRNRKAHQEELQDKSQALIEVNIADPIAPDLPPPTEGPDLVPESKKAPGPEGKLGDPDKSHPTRLARQNGERVDKTPQRIDTVATVLSHPAAIQGALGQVLQGDTEQMTAKFTPAVAGTDTQTDIGVGTKAIGWQGNGNGGGGDDSFGTIRAPEDKDIGIDNGKGPRVAVKLPPKKRKAVGNTTFGTATTSVGCDPGSLRKTVYSRAASIRSCYETHLLANPSLAGQLTVQWTVQEDGRVRSDKVLKDSLDSAPVSDCVLRAVRSMRFAPPEGATCVVSWPFVFSPG